MTEDERALGEQFIQAAEDSDFQAFNECLADGVSVNFQSDVDVDGWTALMSAAGNNCLEMVSLLLMKGASVDLQDEYGRTALMMASECGHHEVVLALLAKGAYVDQKNKDEETALTQAAMAGCEVTVSILLAAGATVDVQSITQSWTPLMLAAFNGHHEVVSVLLAAGSTLDLLDGKTAIDIALEQGHPAIAAAIQAEVEKRSLKSIEKIVAHHPKKAKL